jgi:hypothetical protein
MLILALLLLPQGPTLAQIQELAKSKDVDGLTKVTTLPTGERNPFQVLKSGGAYDTGRFGWTVEALSSPDGQRNYYVLTTPLTSEDVGEIVLERSGTRLSYLPESDALGVKIHRHSLNLRMSLADKTARLVDEMSFTAEKSDQPLLFRMGPAYKVSAIQNGPAAVPFRQAGGVVLTARPAGKSTYKIEYAARVDLPQYAGSISEKEASLVNDYWYPMIARQPVPYDIAVTAPKDWEVVGQGRLVSLQQSGETRVMRFSMDLPVVYYSVSAGPYRTHQRAINDKAYWIRSLRLSADQMALQPDLYAPIVEFYEKSFGKWPFAGYGALDSPAYGGGALEAYSYATYGGGLPDEDPHEPSHTYWGGVLNNTYLRSFWNESFANFSSGLYRRNVSIGNREERRLAFIEPGVGEPGYNRTAIAEGSAFSGPDASSLGYGKGAKVLQMLEQILGTEQTIAAMREWVKVDAGKAVSWEDFERVANRLYPEKRLKTFFDDWLRKPGFPTLTLDKFQYRDGKVVLDLKSANGAFDMPLDVLLQYADGSSEVKMIRVRGSGATSLPARENPVLVSVDPWLRALRKITPDEYAPELQRSIFQMKRFTDPAHSDWLPRVGRTTLQAVPADLSGVFLVGHPDTVPQMKELCAKAGFVVNGNSLTYKGTTIDLNEGAAMALLDVPGGRCIIGLGKTKMMPNAGRAKLAVVDGLGRFLRGVTLPKTAGPLTLRR